MSRAPDLDQYGDPADFNGPREYGDSGEPGDSGEYDGTGEYAVTGPGRSIGIGRRPGRSRAAAARRRRSKRRLVTWGGTVVVVAALVAGWFLLNRSSAPKSRWVQTFQKGEFRTAPDACKVVGSAELQALLKGTPKSVQPFKGSAQSQCTYTVDAKPVFRALSLTVQVFPASLTAPGNGSATANARFTFAQDRVRWAKPSKGTALPPATVSAIRGLGSEALRAVRVFRTGRITNEVTVLVRYRNVLIQVDFQGVTSGGFGPVTTAELGGGALSVARTAFAAVRAEPTVG